MKTFLAALNGVTAIYFSALAAAGAVAGAPGFLTFIVIAVAVSNAALAIMFLRSGS